MRKQIAKSILAAMLITSITGTTVWADSVSDLTDQKNEQQAQLDDFQSQLAYLLVQISDLELQMAAKNDEITQANESLAEAEAKLEQQYADMKLRIQYMYEDQTTSISEALLTAEDMSDALNKTQYVQQVYSYDRDQLDEMAQTASDIKNLKASLEEDAADLEAMSTDMTNKQATLYTAIDEKQSEVSDLDSQIDAAVALAAEQAAATAAAQEAAQKAAAAATTASTSSSTSTSTSSSTSSTTSTTSSTTTTTSSGNSSIASSVVSLAYQMLGVPYVSGGHSPSGFDCSGLMYYIFGQYGIYVSPSSSAIASGGTAVASLADALPGDIICYPGHVALYIGNGQIIHAPVPGDVVKVASATGINLKITAIRRYW